MSWANPWMKKGAVNVKTHRSIHQDPPAFADQATETQILETGIKVVDLLAPYTKGGKIGPVRRGWRWQNRFDYGAD